MSWTLPTPLLLLAAVAFWPLLRLLHRPASLPRMQVEAFLTTLAVIAAVWLGWVAPWLIEHGR